MKRILRSAGALLICSALLTPAAHAYLIVTGNGTYPATANGTTFLAGMTVNKAVFFRPTGEYYFGLAAGGAAGSTGDYALCYGSYRTADTAPVLTKMGVNAAFSTLNIDQLSIVPNSNDATSPTIVAAVGTANLVTSLNATSKSAGAAGTAPVAQAINSPATTLTGGIRAVTASRSSSTGANAVFVAVKVTTGGADATKPFGSGTNAAGGAGTATDGINAGLITQTNGTPVWTSIGATGAGTNTAQVADLTSTGSYLIKDAVITPILMTATGINPAFCYDEQLQRLYVGIQGSVAAGGANVTNGLVGVGIYPVTITAGTSVTVGAQLLPAGSTTDMAAVFTGTTNIVGIAQSNAVSASTILKLATMHTSTGMAYLIVNGNSVATIAAGTAVQVANLVYAVPLVNGTPSATNSVGCFASVKSPDRTVRASAAGDLVTTDSLAAKVGGTGILPVAFGFSGAVAVTDLYVDGDAVYVATGVQDPTLATVSGRNETGLWKSQCVFNDLGQIDHWTDWQKVAPNELGGNANPGTGADPRIDFAAVDSYTGHIWAINNTSLEARVTQWTQPTASPTSQELLASAVNSALSSTCYSVLDFNASTTGWAGANPLRMTAFGGQEKVCFAITGSGSVLGTTLLGSYTAMNTVMTTGNATYDYTNSATFITTSLPSGAGAVVALGWSGWGGTGATTTGFFLAGCAGTAGTAPALYAYSPDGTNGFNPLTITIPGMLSATTGVWTKIANVSGMPIKIQSFGGGLHVLTRTASLDRIYSAPSTQATLATLNSSFVVTASSGNTPTAGSTNSDLSAATHIYDFVVSSSAQGTAVPAIGTEQLVMLTNDGIYTTTSLVGLQAPFSQLTAGWVRLDTPSTSITTLGFFTDYIAGPLYNRLPQTFWFANYAVNPAIADVYNRNIEYQMSRKSLQTTILNTAVFTEDPNNTATFNAAQSYNQTTALTIYQNFPVLYRLFYNDGARRFFITKNPNDDTKYQVVVLPYNLYDYNITSNGKATMTDAVVAQAGAFYWMSPIGDTGRLMMGTSNGVISLQ